MNRRYPLSFFVSSCRVMRLIVLPLCFASVRGINGGLVPSLPGSLAFSTSPPDRQYNEPVRHPPAFGPFHEGIAYRTYLAPEISLGGG